MFCFLDRLRLPACLHLQSQWLPVYSGKAQVFVSVALPQWPREGCQACWSRHFLADNAARRQMFELWRPCLRAYRTRKLMLLVLFTKLFLWTTCTLGASDTPCMLCTSTAKLSELLLNVNRFQVAESTAWRPKKPACWARSGSVCHSSGNSRQGNH